MGWCAPSSGWQCGSRGRGVRVVAIPLLFVAFPGSRTRVLGIRLPWLVLGVLVYPVLYGVGWSTCGWPNATKHDFAGVDDERAMTDSPLTAAALLAAALATVAIGIYGVRLARTTSDFLVASRSVGPRWNAAAISGEYLSAASFLGVAGLIAKYGADALWYPVGFTAGYLGLLLFVAAPLRRSGAYTVPDFAEFRLGSAGCARSRWSSSSSSARCTWSRNSRAPD